MAKNKTNQTVVIRCINCGTLNDEDAEFCKKCAERLKPETTVDEHPKEAKNLGSRKRAAPVRPAVSPAAAVAGIFIGIILVVILVAVVYSLFDLDLSNMWEGSSTSASTASPGEALASGGCQAGSAPAIGNPQKCCDTDYPYYLSSDGKCHKCREGSAPAIGDPQKCCKTSYPYYWSSDGNCHTTQAVTKCQAGSAPAIGDPQKCCSIVGPYYWSSDGKCHKYPKCSQGYAPASNDPSKCCKPSYPYYWGSDDMCHSTNTGATQSTNTGIINNAYTLVQEYQTALTTSNWEVIITAGQELEAYIETYDDILIYDVYFEENLDDLLAMIDSNKVDFEEVCRNGGSYTACTTPISDTATLSCEEAEQRVSDYSSTPSEWTVSYLRTQIGLIDDAMSKCAYIRPSEQMDVWTSSRSQVYALLTQIEQACNSATGERPSFCN